MRCSSSEAKRWHAVPGRLCLQNCVAQHLPVAEPHHREHNSRRYFFNAYVSVCARNLFARGARGRLLAERMRTDLACKLHLAVNTHLQALALAAHRSIASWHCKLYHAYLFAVHTSLARHFVHIARGSARAETRCDNEAGFVNDTLPTVLQSALFSENGGPVAGLDVLFNSLSELLAASKPPAGLGSAAEAQVAADASALALEKLDTLMALSRSIALHCMRGTTEDWTAVHVRAVQSVVLPTASVALQWLRRMKRMVTGPENGVEESSANHARHPIFTFDVSDPAQTDLCEQLADVAARVVSTSGQVGRMLAAAAGRTYSGTRMRPPQQGTLELQVALLQWLLAAQSELGFQVVASSPATPVGDAQTHESGAPASAGFSRQVLFTFTTVCPMYLDLDSFGEEVLNATFELYSDQEAEMDACDADAAAPTDAELLTEARSAKALVLGTAAPSYVRTARETAFMARDTWLLAAGTAAVLDALQSANDAETTARRSSVLQAACAACLACAGSVAQMLPAEAASPQAYFSGESRAQGEPGKWLRVPTCLPRAFEEDFEPLSICLPLAVLRLQELCSAVLLHAPAAGAGGDDATARALASIGDVYLWSSAVGGVAAGVAGVWGQFLRGTRAVQRALQDTPFDLSAKVPSPGFAGGSSAGAGEALTCMLRRSGGSAPRQAPGVASAAVQAPGVDGLGAAWPAAAGNAPNVGAVYLDDMLHALCAPHWATAPVHRAAWAAMAGHGCAVGGAPQSALPESVWGAAQQSAERLHRWLVNPLVAFTEGDSAVLATSLLHPPGGGALPPCPPFAAGATHKVELLCRSAGRGIGVAMLLAELQATGARGPAVSRTEMAADAQGCIAAAQAVQLALVGHTVAWHSSAGVAGLRQLLRCAASNGQPRPAHTEQHHVHALPPSDEKAPAGAALRGMSWLCRRLVLLLRSGARAQANSGENDASTPM